MPSWASDIQPVVQSVCDDCHRTGGMAADKPFASYGDVYTRRSAILNQIYSCYMPPPNSVALTPSQRQALLAWLVCGAPNN